MPAMIRTTAQLFVKLAFALQHSGVVGSECSETLITYILKKQDENVPLLGLQCI